MGSGDRPVVVFDSGVGGLPYLAAARALMPGRSFAYLADRGGFPYGTKTRRDLRERVLAVADAVLKRFDPAALVIACNTASQAALGAVREAHPGLLVVGTVPAVKPAAMRSRSGVIGIMATAGAVEDPYLDELVARHAAGLRVLRVGAQDLVGFVERRLPFATAEERRAAVDPYVRRLVSEGADEIVLACTHFLRLSADIASAAGPGVEVVDSLEGVARRLRAQLEERGLLGETPGQADDDTLFLSGDEPFEAVYASFAASFSLAGPRGLGVG